MADKDEPGRDNAAISKPDTGLPNVPDGIGIPQAIATIEQFNNPVVEQLTTTIFLDFILENPAGEMNVIVADEIIPLEEYFTPWFKVETIEPPSIYEPEIEIYRMDLDQQYCIYRTSFEDNARNYLEWGQIDMDCGLVGGYYDGWSWSNARACGSEHSFKSTMYDEYKNQQQDILYMKDLIDLTADEFDLCDGGTISGIDVNRINVSFDIFVDGEYGDSDWYDGYYSPLDYVQFGIIDGGLDPAMNFDAIEFTQLFITSGGYGIDQDYPFPSESYPHGYGDYGYDDFIFFDTSIDLFDTDTPGYPYRDYTNKAQKIDGCPGWWHVWYEMDVGQIQEFGVWFEWISDKERTFEGAYIDNVEINVIDTVGEKIYQGHSQNWITDTEAGVSFFEFPLKWDHVETTINFVDGIDEDPTFYRAICKIKNDEGGYSGEWVVIDFEVGEVVDCELTSIMVEDDFSHDPIPDGGQLQYPSDAHIKFQYHNNGNDAIEDITIKASGYKLETEVLLEDDFEGMSSWVYFYEDCPVTISDEQAWSGSGSLYFGNPDNNLIKPGCTYYTYCQNFWDMEDVNEAWIDYYWMAVLPEGANFHIAFVGYSYVVYFSTPLIAGPIIQKTWIGPMQPQCSYAQRDIMPYYNTLANYGYMQDANGHRIYEFGLGFFLDCRGVADGDLIPVGAFELDETPWSGVYLDDVAITAQVRGDKVWEDLTVINGPCDPCETCTAQFSWEDVPYSCFEVVVEAICDGDINDDNDEVSSRFCVMEDLEQMSKIEVEDYTECDDTAWCISNVVGNDCGYDQYALATNCDTHYIPEGVNAYIALGPGGEDCCAGSIDISHLDLVGGGTGACAWYQAPEPDTYDPISLPYSSTYYPYRVYDNMDCEGEITEFDFWGLGVYGDGTMLNKDFYIGFFESPTGAVISDQVWTCDNTEYHGTLWGYYEIQKTHVVLPTPVVLDGPCWFSFQMDHYMTDLVPWAAVSGPDGDQYLEQYQYSTLIGSYYYDWAVDFTQAKGAGLGVVCDVVIDEGFESPDYVNPPGWTNTGWLSSLYGDPCEGFDHAYSWSMGDMLMTPLITFGDVSTELRFQYAAESTAHPMDLEVYVDTTMVWSAYGYTTTDCTPVILDLSAFTGDHTISFVGMTSDYYGQILDDVEVEVCNSDGEEPPASDPIWVNMTYQCDIYDGLGEVILEVAGYTEGEDVDNCDGCPDEGCSCPSGIKAWTKIASFSGNAPGVCQYFSANIAESGAFDANTTGMCFRFRLDTSDQDPDNYYVIPGIGFHIHDISISDILYDELTDTTTDFVEDFEDANFVNEESGFEWCIDCVTYGTHWIEGEDDFQFILGGPPEIQEDCWEFTIFGQDSYGDGWDAYYDYVVDAFIDVYLNGELIIEDFTVLGATNSETFEACVGDVISIDYYGQAGSYEGEHYWKLFDEYGTVWAEDGVGSAIPADTVTQVNIILMPSSFPAEPIHEALVWHTEIMDAYEAWFYGNMAYDIGAGAELFVELSADGGNNWFIISFIEGPASGAGAIPCTPFVLTPWAGSELIIRVRLDNEGAAGGYVVVDHLRIVGKQDMLPPSTSIALSGNMVGPGLYAGPVTVTITAVDDMGMGEIHYILDGSETVVSGDKATFKVTADGDHDVEYWGVDATGNEGSHGTTSFSIDNSPPTVSITAPEPGLYLFGNKLLSMSKPFIIGAFTAEATADDGQGIAVVQFLLNGEIVGEDTQAPFDTYVAVKNMGAATLKAVAIDGVGNSAEDSLDITYYKFL